MEKQLKVALVGIGGYGRGFLNVLLDSQYEEDIKFVGAVDPYPQNSERLSDIKLKNIPLFNNLEEFYEENSADLVVISSPIQYHCPQTCLALSHGSHVLCEKPLSATTEEGLKMLEAQKRSGKIVAIGYQWSFSEEILALKKDIINGMFGKAKRLKTLVLWPRTHKYYNSGAWRGQKKDAAGNWVLDSVANNATAHYLHNMFYVLGDSINKSIKPKKLIAETYCANDIDNYDTVAMRVIAENNIELLYIATHAVSKTRGPEFIYEFEKGTVSYKVGEEIIAHFNDGTKKVYGELNTGVMNKFWTTVDCIRNNKDVPCGIKAALSQTLCINGIEKAVPEQVRFPDEMITIEKMNASEELGTWANGIRDVLIESYDKWTLPTELKVKWAKAGKEVTF